MDVSRVYVWESAFNVGAWLASRPDITEGLDVCELGCGIGVPSLVAAKGARSVTATDLSVTAVDVLRSVAAVNKMPPHFRACTLDWFDFLRGAFKPPVDPVDVLLLADVHYYKDAVPALLATCDCLCRPGGLIILGSKLGRIGLDPFQQQLVQGNSQADGSAEYVLEEEHKPSVEHRIWLYRRTTGARRHQ